MQPRSLHLEALWALGLGGLGIDFEGTEFLSQALKFEGTEFLSLAQKIEGTECLPLA